jgi:hypothetical protein
MRKAITRKSLEDRKKEVERVLSNLIPPYYEPAHGQLVFGGKPTVKSQGVYADFASCALDKYSKMVTYLRSNQTTELGSCGPIPNRDEYKLMITGTVMGSFGFEIEEVPRQAAILSELSPMKAAMEKANLVMGLSAAASDEEIAEAIADISTRAIEAIRAFLRVMEEYEALFAIELDNDNKSIRFDNIEQIKQTRERLKPENIHEGDREIIGRFQGVLPEGRTFEFWIKENNEVIRGKVGSEIEDAGNINRSLGKTIKIKTHTRQVGTSQPRYTLNSYEELVE